MSSKEYHKEYNLKRYHKRIQQMKNLLGNRCADCGTEEELQIDHIDPKTKLFVLATEWDRNWKDIEKELTKCQLLCRQCHSDKTITDIGNQKARGKHGTVSSYRYCKCEECKQAKREYMRKYRSTK